jgi:tetratricopeptide (TPR) repeat protein
MKADQPEVLYRNGVRCLQHNDLPSAIAHLRDLLELDPQHVLGWCAIGECLFGADKQEASLIAFKRAVAIDPAKWTAWFNLGLLHQNAGRFEEAESAYHRVLELQANHDQTHLNLATLLQETGKLDEAWPHYRAAYASNPAGLGRIANALTSAPQGKMFLNLEGLKSHLAS